ncbi:hypothetical protein [Streptomyces sp. NPDC048603]|uniref:hypothetical protein n=1 Tax=Streptomyces sp. NPDC048603 TaxID=3365577 RepID=UPI003721ED84
MSGDDELQISAQAVQGVQSGLRAAISELRESGADAGGASMGAGFEDLSMTGMEAGHPGLATDFEDFCERWEWGVRSLVQNASVLAARMGIAAGTLWEEDQYRHGSLKVLVNSLYGNPYASEDEVEKKPWGDFAKLPWEVYKPDWSVEDFDQARKDMGQTWKDTGRELEENGRIGSLKDLLDQTGDGTGNGAGARGVAGGRD